MNKEYAKDFLKFFLFFTFSDLVFKFFLIKKKFKQYKNEQWKVSLLSTLAS